MTKKKATLSLVGFMMAERRKDCPVCQLPEEVRAQLKEASRKKIPRALQVEWLQNEVGVSVISQDLTNHYSGRHDDGQA